jgi:predicted amidohydrolase YtcJ
VIPQATGEPTAPITGERIVYENCTIFDPNISHEQGSVIVTSGERILAVGHPRNLGPLIDGATRIDLGGAAAYPGFIDAHAHFIDTGLMASRPNLGSCRKIADVLELISAQVDGSTSEWIFAGNLDENFLAEKRVPSLAELDAAAGGRPVYINHRSYHWTLVNSSALALLDLDPAPPGIVTDPHGQPTGLLNIDANAAAKVAVARLVPDDDVDAGIQAAGRIAASGGMTTVHCIEGGDEYGGARFVDRLIAAQGLTFEPIVYFNTERPAEAEERGLPRVGGDLTIDGSISNWTAAFSGGYVDRETIGHLYYTPEQLQEMITAAHTRGMQISFHAIGDQGVSEILDAYAAVLARYPARDHRHRIEHFGLPTTDFIVRARGLGLVVSVQPAFMFDKLPTYATRVGDRASNLYPLRSLLEAGLTVAGSSDTMVSRFDALYGIHAAVNGPIESERLTVDQAVGLYTTGAARAAFRENDIGALRAGMYADIAVLDRDLRTVPREDIGATTVLRTIFRGRTVHTTD